MNFNLRIVVVLVAVVILVVVGVVVLMPRLSPQIFHGMVLQATEPADDFTLTAHTGERVSLSDYRGKHVILYFGYTFCPDVCPLTLADLGQAMRLIGEDKAEQVQVLFVSVDPERDTPERLSHYAPAFYPTFLGLTGTEEEIANAATPLGIFYARNEVEGASDYLMDHTASVTMLDDKGRIRLIWPFDTSPEFMAEDLEYFLR
ncbi:MAG: SCO family protein [Chloroflexi bacterium]|nr:SCO family protein [Chloroflexota bacterium]